MAGRDALFQVVDPQNTLVMKRGLRTSEMGIAATDFQLADQVRLGTYVISVTIDGAVSRREVDVRRYSLPKLALKLELESPSARPAVASKAGCAPAGPSGSPWRRLASRSVSPRPQPRRKALRAATGAFISDLAAPFLPGRHTLTAKLDAGGGFVVESAAELLVADLDLIQLEVHPESGALIPSLENRVYAITTGAGDKPLSADVVLGERSVRTDEHGLECSRSFRARTRSSWSPSSAARSPRASSSRTLSVPLLRPVDGAAPGSKLPLEALSRPEDAGDIGAGSLAGEELVATGNGTARETDAPIELPKQAHGLLRIVASRYLPQGRLLRDERLVSVKGTGELAVRAELDCRLTHRAKPLVHLLRHRCCRRADPGRAGTGRSRRGLLRADGRAPGSGSSALANSATCGPCGSAGYDTGKGYRYRGEAWPKRKTRLWSLDAALRRSVRFDPGFSPFAARRGGAGTMPELHRRRVSSTRAGV
ncbi:MAG: hypothetical protein U0263_38385 [Polyangiaceae bacterium]